MSLEITKKDCGLMLVLCLLSYSIFMEYAFGYGYGRAIFNIEIF
ncbi:uncharacterized protein METZ01_LOCUS162738 [marine metagenome]|uniref:Uncharacterized protein n=1 Tax=marine metagenome TaxID=408172 RepID=A0A382B8D1_9ZZZZ